MEREEIKKFYYEDKGVGLKTFKVNDKEINCKGITKIILTFEGGCRPHIDFQFSTTNANLIPKKEINE